MARGSQHPAETFKADRQIFIICVVFINFAAMTFHVNSPFIDFSKIINIMVLQFIHGGKNQ